MIQAIKKAWVGDPIRALESDSKSILDIFTITVRDLEEVNNKAEIETKKRIDEINKLTGELSSLGNIRQSNASIIEKINKILT